MERRLLDRTSSHVNCIILARGKLRENRVQMKIQVISEFLNSQKSHSLLFLCNNAAHFVSSLPDRLDRISSPRSTVAVKSWLCVVFTHISCVAVRAVSFGASASFGSARLSVRPPALYAFDCDRLVPKKSSGREHQVRKYPSTIFPRDNPTWDKSCLLFRLHTCGHPTSTCPATITTSS